MFVGPADPFITMLKVIGRRTENQYGHPPMGGIPGDVVKAFAHRAEAAQVMVLIEQLVDSGYLCTRGEVDANLPQELLLGLVG